MPLVRYSLGNFISSQNDEYTDTTAVLTLELTRDNETGEAQVTGYSYAPMHMLDIAKGLLDHGIHPPTMYFPLIVHEALMVEPTETESQETMDEVCRVFLDLWDLAHQNPQALHDAPTRTPVRRLDEVGAARNPVLRYVKE